MKNNRFATILLVSVLLSALATKLWIGLSRRADVGQPIREEGNKEHYKKQGTPTMGGVAFSLLALLLGFVFEGFNKDFLLLILSTLGFGLIGFIDDYEKVKKKENEGLTPNQKLALQLIIAIITVVYAELSFDKDYQQQLIPIFNIPVKLSFLAYPALVFIIMGTVNSTNLTDGLDGLLAGVSIPVFFTISLLATAFGPATSSVYSYGLIFAGVLVGYLFFNANPASVMMGDTGSMAIGGAVCAMLLRLNLLPYLILLGGIYFAEALSVIIQRFYFRRTGGKRIFLMSPIHHHFELKGYKEQKITASFSIVSAILCLLTLMAF